MRIVAVVPALDEAPRIAAVVAGLPTLVDRIVVVDDGSRDDTAAIARAADPRRCEVIVHARRRGVGAAIATGYARALALDADVAVVLAGDGQMDPRDLPALLAPIAGTLTIEPRSDRAAPSTDGSRADYVKGNRFAWPEGTHAFPLARLVGGVVFSALTRLATGLDIDDSQCGYTAISRRALRAIDWTAAWPSYGYPNDLLIRFARLGLRVAEVPVRPIYAGEVSRLRARHLPPIAGILARGMLLRLADRVRQR